MLALIISEEMISYHFQEILKMHDIQYNYANCWEDADYSLDNNNFDFISLNDNIKDITLLQIIQRIKRKQNSVKIIVFVNKNNNEFLSLQNFDDIFYTIKKPYKISCLKKVIGLLCNEIKKK